MMLAGPLIGRAQAPEASATANPVTASVREIYNRVARFIPLAAEEMPTDKYS